MREIQRFLVVALAVFTLSGCCPCRFQKSAGGDLTVGSAWKALQIEGKNVTPNEDSYFIIFGEDGNLMGRGDCNRIMGQYELSEVKQLKIKGLASTRAMCPNQSVEDKFLSVLRLTQSYTIDGAMLMLLNQGDVVMILEPFQVPQ